MSSQHDRFDWVQFSSLDGWAVALADACVHACGPASASPHSSGLHSLHLHVSCPSSADNIEEGLNVSRQAYRRGFSSSFRIYSRSFRRTRARQRQRRQRAAAAPISVRRDL